MTKITTGSLSRRNSSSLSDNNGGFRASRAFFFFALGSIATIVCGAIYMLASSDGGGGSTSSNQGLLSSSVSGGGGGGDAGHIVVIDAGSSGSRAHVFQYNANGIVDPKHESLKTKPGLSSFATAPQDAGASLNPLLDFARQHIPASDVKKTKIVLKATAGMRLLQQAEQDAIIDNVRDHLSKSGFDFSIAEVIDGKEEGLLGWLAVNYLNNDPDGSWGVLELGGASIQFTLPIDKSSPDAVPIEHKRSYRDSVGNHGEVFTHSFIGLGMQSARDAINQALKDSGASNDPCLQASYLEEHEEDEFSGVKSITPAGDFDECSKLVSETLFRHTTVECNHPNGCLYNGMFAPSMKGGKFWAFENFFYTPSGLGINGAPGTITIEDLTTAGKEVCGMNWKKFDQVYPKDNQPKEVNEKWCFGSVYLSLLLTEGLGFQPNQQITVGNNVGDNGIDWALGAALQAVLDNDASTKASLPSNGGGGGLRTQSNHLRH